MQIFDRSSIRQTSSTSRTSRTTSSSGASDASRTSGLAESFPLLAGAAVGIGGVGAALVLADVDSPLRAPFTLFFLFAAPAAALAGALPRLDALTRTVVAVIGAGALNLLVAQAMLATHVWSVRGGVLAVGVLSAALLLTTLARGPYSPGAGGGHHRQGG